MKQIIFHGSEKIIESPVFGQGKAYNDYGKGFYCTENASLAKEWACGRDRDGYANCYEIETEGLRTLDLASEEYNILHWMALLLDNRRPSVASPVAKAGMKYFRDNFLLEIRDYDIIKGYRADDSYFSFARAFLNNQISLEQLSIAMKLGKLGEQVVLKSKEAFERLEFVSYEVADCSIYFGKRSVRDEMARAEFTKMLETGGFEGIYMRDLLQKGESINVKGI